MAIRTILPRFKLSLIRYADLLAVLPYMLNFDVSFAKFAGCKIIYFDAGIYIVSSTLKIPAGVQIVGEAWTTIMGSGDAFSSIDDPSVVVQVGAEGSTGIAEISSLLFTTLAPAGGAILVEWNVHDPSGNKGAAGMWDTVRMLSRIKHAMTDSMP